MVRKFSPEANSVKTNRKDGDVSVKDTSLSGVGFSARKYILQQRKRVKI